MIDGMIWMEVDYEISYLLLLKKWKETFNALLVSTLFGEEIMSSVHPIIVVSGVRISRNYF